MLISDCFETISILVFLKRKKELCFRSVSLSRNVLAPPVDVTQITGRGCTKILCFYISWEYTGAQGQVRKKCFCFKVNFISLVSRRTRFRQSVYSLLSPSASTVPSEYFCLFRSQRWLNSSFLVKWEWVLERDPEWWAPYRPAVFFFPQANHSLSCFLPTRGTEEPWGEIQTVAGRI